MILSMCSKQKTAISPKLEKRQDLFGRRTSEGICSKSPGIRKESIDDDATRPDGTDAAETEPAGTADDDDTWVDPQTGEKFSKLSPFEAKVVALTLGDAVKQLRLLQQLKVDPEDQVRQHPTTLTATTNPPRSESDGVQPFPRR